MTVEELLRNAVRLQQEGKPAEAEKIYRQILNEDPRQADALGLLGSISLARGDLNGAIDLLRRAITARPDFADAHKGLGAILAKTGRAEEATACFQALVRLRPMDAAAHAKFGELLAMQGRSGEADISARRARLLDPEFLARVNNLAKLLLDKDQKNRAMREYLEMIKSEKPPGDAVLAGGGFGQEMAEAVTGHAAMAMFLAEERRFDEAAEALAVATFLAPRAAMTHEARGKFHSHRGELAQSIESFRAAIAVDPKRVSSMNYLGVDLRAQGKFDEAADWFQKMVNLRPDLALGYSYLASISRLDREQANIGRLLQQLEQKDLSLDNRIALRFALANAFDKSDRYDEAFEQFDRANALVKQQRAQQGEFFDPEVRYRQIADISGTFTPEFFEKRSDWGEPSELPVFVVGMPRSGTTLLQQIAASHPMVHGAGELADIGEIAAAMKLDDLEVTGRPGNAQKIRSAAKKHLRRLKEMDPKAIRVIDKMPNNVFRLALIRLLFPSARVILCRRDARDNCLSCFFQWFGEANAFSFDLANCGHEYLACERVMEHWRQALPMRMLEVNYEAVCADLEGQSRRLIDFLGLEWDPACLEFHRTPGEVHTSSVWQVRQPIYQSSVGRWKHYEKHLGPLMRVLEGKV